jgi:hypothetical protein
MLELNLDKAYQEYQDYINNKNDMFMNRFGEAPNYTFSQFIYNDIDKYLIIKKSDENHSSDYSEEDDGYSYCGR